MKTSFSILMLFFILGLHACTENSSNYLGEMNVPSDNPINEANFLLGEKLFFDKRLSQDNSVSCASCHQPKYAFTDRKKVGEGVQGRKTLRNTPTLINVAYSKHFMFDGAIKTIEEQVLAPISDSNEMNSSMREIVQKLKYDVYYRKQSKKIFGTEITPFVITRSIAAYVRLLTNDNSKFDLFFRDKKSVLSPGEKRGWNLFSKKLACTQCHPPPHFTTYQLANNGLYSDFVNDQGRYRIDGVQKHKGFFKIPTLRNIALTAPYMHDGSLETLVDVIEHYQKGGNKHINQSPYVRPFILTEIEKADLIAFLRTLTSEKINNR